MAGHVSSFKWYFAVETASVLHGAMYTVLCSSFNTVQHLHHLHGQGHVSEKKGMMPVELKHIATQHFYGYLERYNIYIYIYIYIWKLIF